MPSATERQEPEQLGDAPIEEGMREFMAGLARALDEMLNGTDKGAARKNGFVLMIFPFADFDGRCNYISNGADRKDVVTLMREQIARFEGQPDVKGQG